MQTFVASGFYLGCEFVKDSQGHHEIQRVQRFQEHQTHPKTRGGNRSADKSDAPKTDPDFIFTIKIRIRLSYTTQFYIRCK